MPTPKPSQNRKKFLIYAKNRVETPLRSVISATWALPPKIQLHKILMT